MDFLGCLFETEDGSSTLHRNTGDGLPDYTASHSSLQNPPRFLLATVKADFLLVWCGDC
jgi:hypothetical protein